MNTTQQRDPMQNGMAVGQTIALIPFINEMLAKGHIIYNNGTLEVAPDVKADQRFAWMFKAK